VKLLLKVGVVLQPETRYFGRAEVVTLWGWGFKAQPDFGFIGRPIETFTWCKRVGVDCQSGFSKITAPPRVVILSEIRRYTVLYTCLSPKLVLVVSLCFEVTSWELVLDPAKNLTTSENASTSTSISLVTTVTTWLLWFFLFPWF
jgi:hypothetical protein